ncbi:MAG: zincin-like metallopeptidase domain-containing protein [Acidobacteria bacterium]|nr:zincin-like metallopeptidase domain-containing protein [Acidobacteriota bacterium]
MAPSKDRVGEYHKTFARQIIRQLKEGTAPFQKPWKPGERSLPENLATGRRYAGGNSLYLGVAAQMKGYTDNRWATYRQIREAGGHVQRGERATQILFFSTTKLVPAKDDQGNPKLNDASEPVYTVLERPKPFVRTYSVFNAEQTGGLPERPPATAPPEWEGHAAADAIIETSGVTVKHQAGDRAYYNLRTDEVVLPEPGQFPSTGSYYQTAIHELGHATGHPDRLNRNTLGKKFGSPEYAREELRAEIAAMMTGEKIGLGHEPQNDSAAYVASWVKALEDDPREIYRAAADAERISRYLIEPARERIEQLERREGVEPTQALEAAAAQQQAATRFNENISRAAEAALDVLRPNGNEDRPPEKLIRDLQAVHLTASQNIYTPKTADFRGLRDDLENHAIDAQSLSSDERKAVLTVANSFANQAQNHALHDRAIAERAHGRDVGPTRG